MSISQRKLKALEWPHGPVALSDVTQIQKLVHWLEDFKIRLYKQEDRIPLKEGGENWNKFFFKYLSDIACPRKYSEQFTSIEMASVVDWLVGHAVYLEYKDNAEEYNQESQKMLTTEQIPEPMEEDDETLYKNPEFNNAVMELAKTLKIPPHDDIRLVLKAVLEIVKHKFTTQALEEAKTETDIEKLDLSQFPLGFDTGDPELNKAATVLRMLYIEDIRSLQTKINEILVAIQNYTANPKTDSALGKVGR